MLPLREYIKEPRICLYSLLREYGFMIPDRLYLQMIYYLKMGKRLNLANPQTFGEKMQWLKLNDRNPRYTMMVDKYAVKDFVAKVIGKQYVIPTLALWDNPNEVNLDDLPQQFVIKTTHGGGGDDIFVCKDKTFFNRDIFLQQFNKSIQKNTYIPFREWPYKNVHRRIMAERFIYDSSNPNSDLTDYKFYCFSGVPTFCQVIKNRHVKETIDFFDMDWRHLEFYGLNPKAKPSETEIARPVHFDKMKEIARQLSVGLLFSRIDLYDTSEGPFFGEITLYPNSGFGLFTPSKYNIILGNMIHLPNMGKNS